MKHNMDKINDILYTAEEKKPGKLIKIATSK